MIIRSINLETVCGVTSKLPENDTAGDRICGEIKRGKIFPDQRTDESEVLCKNFGNSRERPRPLTSTISMKRCIW